MRLLTATVAAAAILGAAAPSIAATSVQSREASQEQIQIGSVDFRDAAQVRSAYKRLQQAALFVCNVQMDADRAQKAADRACAEQALKDAVNKLDRPMLTAMHQQSGAPMLARGY